MEKFYKRFALVGVALGLVLIGVGCSPGAVSAKQGTLTFNVTDAPPKDEVTSVMITLSGLQVHKAVAEPAETPATTTTADTASTTTTTTSTTEETEDTGEWLTVEIPANAQTFDLLKVKGIEQLLTTSQMNPGLYTQIRLTVEKAEVSLAGGALQAATVPSGVLKIVQPFKVNAGETTTLTLDFDAAKSVNVTGNGKVMIKPVIKLLVSKSSGPKPAEFNQQQSQKVAEDFVKNSPTFVFDGITATLALTDTAAQTTANTWQFTYEFDSAQAGYGDRTGQILAQVVTHHVAVIVVEKGSVTSAVLDGQWNELTQEMLLTPATSATY
ncbi:MAG: DUF4382 domain-containing protein [Dehalococcoidales bacterium]|nr:DUF4382 domain-containing protein [Dehalococcoidales bacterium]